MARDPFFVKYMREKLTHNLCEIGIHPHAWSTPPFVQVTSDDCKNHPFLIDYPLPLMEEKFVTLLNLLTDTFKTPIISHRAGRWALNEDYVSLLAKHGIKADCTVLPHNRIPPSSSETRKAVSFLSAKSVIYEMSTQSIQETGNSGVYEIPVTVLARCTQLRKLCPPCFMRGVNKFFPHAVLRLNRNNLPMLLQIIDRAVKDKFEYLEFMLHSSELMPGCSPVFPSERSIEKAYTDLEILFSRISRWYSGRTFKEFLEIS